MTAQVLEPEIKRASAAAFVIPAAIFLSALLVFLVQPLVAKLLLPSLGGAPAVWNTSLVFFQAALLLGYAYAHALQRIRAVRVQALIHVGVLAISAAALPLRASGMFGPPPVDGPIWWLLAVLTVSVGAPFAALSATAPLLQAWWAARFGEARNPYALYAASNLGSLAALLGYPLAVEPSMSMDAQRLSWTAGYGVFVLAAVTAAVSVGAVRRAVDGPAATASSGRIWRQRIWWAVLGAIPSSLLLGVTAHISTDVASAPFLWVIPLALYLLTFIIAFQDRPPVPRSVTLIAQGLLAPLCLILTYFSGGPWLGLLALHLATFFFTALLCHSRLAEDRPEPGRLTEFYLAMSVGGVLGGALNAFVAPQIFELVWEYPLVLIAAAIARPLGPRRPTTGYVGLVLVGLGLAAVVFLLPADESAPMAVKVLIAAIAGAAFLLRDRAPGYVLVLAALLAASVHAAGRNNYIADDRSFFGVYRTGYNSAPKLGPVKFIMHGTTLHGAQATGEGRRCTPLTYYARPTPIGQATTAMQTRGALRIGVVGLGAGTMAAYARPGDSLRFFEIDPLMADIARTNFTYLSECASDRADVVIGDARLTVAREPEAAFDLLVIDAFSSDAVPTHLMTVEAMQGWLRVLKPDGLLVLHVSNKHLALREPVAASLRELGIDPVAQFWSPPASTPPFEAMTSHVVAASRDGATLAALRRQGAWSSSDPEGVAAWTDDRSDVLGALIRRARAR